MDLEKANSSNTLKMVKQMDGDKDDNVEDTAITPTNHWKSLIEYMLTVAYIGLISMSLIIIDDYSPISLNAM